MKKHKILGLLILLMSITSKACDYTTQLNLNDLEFYVNALNCFESYIYCINNILPKNKTVNCLTNSNCQNMSLLQALLGLPYVQTQVLNPQQTAQINKLLVTYGRDNLEQLVEEYPAATISKLINELTTYANTTGLTTLTDANMRPTPPAGFNG